MPEAKTIFSSIDEFRQAARSQEQIAARVRSSFDTEVKAKDGERALTFTISTASIDRMGDTISVEGWRLEAYRKNPVVLWAHDSSMLPVAKAPKIWIESGKLKADAEFTPTGMARFNDTVFEMYKQGFLSATSVGFAPLKYAFTDDPKRSFGIDFMEQELLEFSAVPVPANADALIEGRSAGIDIGPVLDWCGLAMKRAGDSTRIVKLAEEILGAKGDDPALLTWAKGIIDSAGQSLIETERLAAINALAEDFRADAKKASGSKGASGIYRRCANRVEKAVMGEAAAEDTASSAAKAEAAETPVNVVSGFAEIAARRLTAVRNKTA